MPIQITITEAEDRSDLIEKLTDDLEVANYEVTRLRGELRQVTEDRDRQKRRADGNLKAKDDIAALANQLEKRLADAKGVAVLAEFELRQIGSGGTWGAPSAIYLNIGDVLDGERLEIGDNVAIPLDRRLRLVDLGPIETEPGAGDQEASS